MNKQTLIEAMQEKINHTEEGDQVLYIQDVIDIITQHLDGYVIVPEEPTEAMLDALYGECCCSMNYGNDLEGPHCDRCATIDPEGGYTSMIKASQESNDNGKV